MLKLYKNNLWIVRAHSAIGPKAIVISQRCRGKNVDFRPSMIFKARVVGHINDDLTGLKSCRESPNNKFLHITDCISTD